MSEEERSLNSRDSILKCSNGKNKKKITKKRCLIANDDSFQLNMLSQLFEIRGYDVMVARNGHEAYEAVVETLNSPSELLDLIVLDLNMPITNGYESCQNI